MSLGDLLSKPELFSEILYEKMKRINPGIEDVELYEFRYGLDNLVPAQGNWSSISLETKGEINQRLNDINFYRGIQIKPLSGSSSNLPLFPLPTCCLWDWFQVNTPLNG
jgi:hypothetical protein